MAYPSRPTSMFAPGTSAAASLRQPSGHHNISQQQSTALASRIAAKQAELDNLKQLRDMSASLAVQMQTLESKLGTLKDGTEAVACVLANWDNVLRAIGMASTNVAHTKGTTGQASGAGPKDGTSDGPMPATLVRIPEAQQNASNKR
ncbi:DASH complex subunit DAD2 [Aspergillus candidus]|uniref:DASH complex subunit DAD2 n=2 Tax=Aspergillus subgen. Circumdati TaxID=2720871 RepID=A0A2I2F1T8_ASPCN|nr:DASH complex subunit Dad2-domain-containing protein [Aspergillus candidus]PLB34568.1 DASH complex subunit Dad2-domain-containing protein [Aspergillus candidus]